MAITWALFVLALAGWLAVTAVLWTVLYAETKRRVRPSARPPGDPRREDGDDSGDSPA